MSIAIRPAVISGPSAISDTDRAPQSYAAIDFGSSSAELLVQRRDAKGQLRTVLDKKLSTALGKDIGPDKLLPLENRERGLEVLRAFLADAARFGVKPEDVELISTAVMRNTLNGAEYAQQIRDEVGIKRARILSGEEEAQLGYQGAVKGAVKNESQKLATLDLGGGSFQLAIGTGNRFEKGGSTQIGSNYIVENLLKRGVLTSEQFAAADTALKELAPLPLPVEQVKGREVVAVGGVANFLGAHLGKAVVTRDEVEALRRSLGSMSLEERGETCRAGKDSTTLSALGIDTVERGYEYGVKVPSSLTLMVHVMDGLGLDWLRIGDTDARDVLVAQAAARDTATSKPAPKIGWGNESVFEG
ncbi:MAG: Ppx/GppA phosphatase family protein [Myxococcaceae bacterium]